MFEIISMDVEKYERIVKNIETAGDTLLAKRDCHTASERAVSNVVIKDYVVAYEGMVKTINYLTSVNSQIVTTMNNVMAYHKKIDQQKSDELELAGDVFSSDEE